MRRATPRAGPAAPRDPGAWQAGLSLLELLVALAVLSIGVLALALAQVGALRVIQLASRLQRAAAVVEGELADLRAAPRPMGDGACRTLPAAASEAGWRCEIRLGCVGGACRSAGVRLDVTAPDGQLRTVFSAVTWPNAAAGGTP